MSVMEMAAKTKFAGLTFEEKLDRLAEVAVKIGLGLRAGQELVMSAPMEALPLVRRITEHAYKAGALLVTTFYSDDPAVLARYQYAQDASFDYAPKWLQDGIAERRSAVARRGWRLRARIRRCWRSRIRRRWRGRMLRRRRRESRRWS